MIRWLAHYGSEPRNSNAEMDWTIGGMLGFLRPSRDTTVSAYARQVQEHAQENDRHAARLMEGQSVEEFVQTEAQTTAYTQQKPK